GLGAASLAMFHLMTHACFKALLFLGAGSVIHATNQQELSHLGGLRRAMPWTSTVVLIAALSMSGVFPLSGFWSKDAILLAIRQSSLPNKCV
ncbi:MAG: NADH-quinone oxidoreductase subunit L, partial [Candidatus Omnitrophica bacterium]|nr:NADH-quinone oxidoreductase subunit L [Candidatus Omnitrophota bacterium]